MSQDELADKLGVSRQSISLWETGQTQPTIENIIALSKISGAPPDALLGVEGGASPAPIPAPAPKKKKKGVIALIVAIIVLVVAVVGYAVYALINGAVGFGSRHGDTHNVDTTETTVANTETDTDAETTETEKKAGLSFWAVLGAAGCAAAVAGIVLTVTNKAEKKH